MKFGYEILINFYFLSKKLIMVLELRIDSLKRMKFVYVYVNYV